LGLAASRSKRRSGRFADRRQTGCASPSVCCGKDIADYLGLNPDTLSRIMSRLKAAGLIGQSERNRAVVHDFPTLAARDLRRHGR
jgi:CRP-like cAMP-binding protein